MSKILSDKKITIAIDGPAGAGKTTIAQALSKKLNIMYLSTGALYRAYAVKYLDNKLDINSPDVASKVAKDSDITVKFINGTQHTFLDGIDVSDRLYNDAISMISSTISKQPVIRQSLKSLQQKIADEQSVIMDGRDIGSVVLPKADYKFYLDADVKVRAERRFKQLLQKGEKANYDEVLQDMINRDINDTTRNISPLKKCKDSIVIDCTNLGIDEVVNEFLKHIKG